MRPSPLFAVAVATIVAAACAHNDPRVAPSRTTDARLASTGVKQGDCTEALQRAALHPDLPVDRLPTPLAMRPAPLEQVPASALRKDGSAEVKIAVLVDTLGRADMSTFEVVTASDPWLVDNVRGVIGKWKFTPARLAGCKVPRTYHFMARTAARH